MQKQIESVIDNTKVSCAVTNLTGTQSDYLSLPDWTVKLFREPDANSVSPPEIPFLDYLTDIQFKVSTKGEMTATKQLVDVSGITSFSADRSSHFEDYSISWFEGFDESFLEGSEAACLLPADLYNAMPTDTGQGSSVSITFYGKYNRSVFVSKDLVVAGVYNGNNMTVYCPWDVISDAYVEVNGAISADCIYATISDNRKISEFRELCASLYFAEPDPKGIPQPWDASPIYDHFPYAFAVYDEILNGTIATLERNRTIFSLCQKMAIFITLIMGIVIGNLSTRQQQKDLALKYVLGCSKIRIFSEASAAHLSLSFIGLVIAISASVLLTNSMPPWGTLLRSFAANYIGAAIATCRIFVNSDILQLTKEEC